MKTTVDIPESLLKDAMRYSKSSTKREAVLAALEEYSRRQRAKEAVARFGTFKEFMTPSELRRVRDLRRLRHEVQRRDTH